jgi:NAD(P)-dependent dehydrogenase (short-subunit alcohol dehydrogenase family)
MFTKSLALDLIRYNIRVNSLCPGVTMTPLLEQEIAAAPDPFKHREMQNSELIAFGRERSTREPLFTVFVFPAWAPINRVSSPREQAYGALFLAGDESSFSVGATLVLDGGFLSR